MLRAAKTDLREKVAEMDDEDDANELLQEILGLYKNVGNTAKPRITAQASAEYVEEIIKRQFGDPQMSQLLDQAKKRVKGTSQQSQVEAAAFLEELKGLLEAQKQLRHAL